MSVRVEVRPNVLAWARARSGIDDEAWAQRFPRYEEWRSGDASPTLKQLEVFAQRTHTPVGFLFLDEPPVETVPIPDFRTVRDRPVDPGHAQVVSADLLDVVYTCQARQEWYRDHQLLNGEPPLEFVGTAGVGDSVDRAADEMRSLFDWTTETRDRCRTVGRGPDVAAGACRGIRRARDDQRHRRLRHPPQARPAGVPRLRTRRPVRRGCVRQRRRQQDGAGLHARS